MKDSPAPQASQSQQDNPGRSARPVLLSTELFGDAHEVIIEHLGVEYRLRQTRNGKLLLYK